jgi:hypothetical protein
MRRVSALKGSWRCHLRVDLRSSPAWMPAWTPRLFAIDLEKGIARRVIELFAISYLKDTALQNPRPAPRPMIVLRHSRSWMPNNLYCFNTVASVTNDPIVASKR